MVIMENIRTPTNGVQLANKENQDGQDLRMYRIGTSSKLQKRLKKDDCENPIHPQIQRILTEVPEPSPHPENPAILAILITSTQISPQAQLPLRRLRGI